MVGTIFQLLYLMIEMGILNVYIEWRYKVTSTFIKVCGTYSLIGIALLSGIQCWANAQQKQISQEREGIYQKYEAIGISLR